ncbi:MAG TPA: hypothetical protein VFF73_19470 [Planctomycetota bacterium]|nr:hypothetical protein [Planctomycetota bacterium]
MSSDTKAGDAAREERIAKLKQAAADSQGKGVSMPNADTDDSELANTADHIADLHVFLDNGRLLVQFKVANSKGDPLAISGKIAAYARIEEPGGPGRVVSRTTVIPAAPKVREQIIADTKIEPERLVNGLGQETIGYRLDAITRPAGCSAVRVVFILPVRGARQLEATATVGD